MWPPDPTAKPGPWPPTMPTQPGWHCTIPLEKAFPRGCLLRGDNWQEAWRLFMPNSSEKCSEPCQEWAAPRARGLPGLWEAGR